MTVLAFSDQDVPTLAAMADIIANDPDYPPIAKDADGALCRKLEKWVETPEGRKGSPGFVPGIAAATIPFTRQNLKAMSKKLNPGVLGVVTKTIENAISIANRIADYFDHPRGYAWSPLSPAAQRLQDVLRRREDRGGCARLLTFISARNLDPAAMSDQVAAEFRQELERDWRVDDKERSFRRALYAWNAAVKAHPDDWPQVALTLPIKRVVWGKPWSFFPPQLEKSVDNFFADRLPGSELHDLGVGLEPISAAGQKESLRMMACALLYEDIPLDELINLRALSKPDHYDIGMRHLRKRTGAANATVDKYGRDLAKVAKHAGVLSKAERKLVKKAAKKWRQRYAQFKKTHEDRDQEILDNLDDPKVCDKLLQLAQRTVRQVKKSRNPLSVGAAYAIMRALIIEMWLCAPIRLKNVLELEFEKHFIEVELDGKTYVALRLKAHETKNRNGEEHFLNDDAAALLELFMSDYHDIILKANKAAGSKLLFPGEGGAVKSRQSARVQMSKWITKHTGLKFHPHAIRKIAPKIILDIDPTAIEAAISAGGWKDDRMLRKIYGQRTHRATQKTYIELLEGRRLTALGTMRRRGAGGAK